MRGSTSSSNDTIPKPIEPAVVCLVTTPPTGVHANGNDAEPKCGRRKATGRWTSGAVVFPPVWLGWSSGGPGRGHFTTIMWRSPEPSTNAPPRVHTTARCERRSTFDQCPRAGHPPLTRMFLAATAGHSRKTPLSPRRALLLDEQHLLD